MRVIALLTTRNESRFIEHCIRHLNDNGVEVYVLDHASDDGTPELARRNLGHGVVAVENVPYHGYFSLREQLRRKEALCATLTADWFMHVDADEIHVARPSALTLAQAYARAEGEGYNAINFIEYTFVPVREHPDHDHQRFQETMRWYYPFLPAFPHRVNAWKASPAVELEWSGGHDVRFDGRNLYPVSFVMRHYIFLGPAHAREKYARRRYAPGELAHGWHGGARGWRHRFERANLCLPSAAELQEFVADDLLDVTNLRTRHAFITPLT
jgi:hypothetical protein